MIRPSRVEDHHGTWPTLSLEHADHLHPSENPTEWVYWIRIMQSEAPQNVFFFSELVWSKLEFRLCSWSPRAWDSQSLPLDVLSRGIHAAPCWPARGAHNHYNFGLCCQQPQGAPQAVMETLLAVAAHQSDGRVGTVSLPHPAPQPHLAMLSPCLLLMPAHVWLLHGCPHHPAALLLAAPDLHFFPDPAFSSPLICYFLSFSAFPPLPFPSPSSSALGPFPGASPSHAHPRGPGSFPHLMSPGPCMWWHVEGCPCSHSPCPVETWLLVWSEVVSACLVGCHACLRTTAVCSLALLGPGKGVDMGLFPGMAEPTWLSSESSPRATSGKVHATVIMKSCT